MIVTVVYVDVKADHVEAFKAATILNHEASVQEPGNLRFDLIQQEEDPTSFVLYEAYQDEEAARAHKDTDHYLVWRRTVAEMMASPRKGVRYQGIRPE